MKMWEGPGRLDPKFEQWQRSLAFDCRLLKYEVAASQAHARALEGCGVLSRDELAAIVAGLKAIAEAAARDSSVLDDPEAEDVHHFVEKQLVARIGETAYKLHSGRSRNEQIATDLRLYVRDSIDLIQAALGDLIAAFLDRAEQSGAAAMPGYTHSQRAEPVPVAHWLLAYVEMFFRDADRLADCRKRVNLCPLGTGAIAGSTLPLDREAMARELGFDAPTANSMDACCDRDFAIEFTQVLALVAVHLSRWAEEMILFSTQEFGFVRLPDGYATGSSAMPQKKNPDALELIRGKAARVLAASQALLVTSKGLPMAYNKDLQETQEPVFEAAETIAGVLSVAVGFMSAVGFNTERMQAAAQSGFMNAMAAATYLAKRGVPFRLAHRQIGAAVRRCLATGRELADLSLEELRQFGEHFDSGFYAALNLDAVLSCHDVIGGAAPARVRQAMTQARERLAALRGEVHAHA
jgi:argininosuccinate lyase